jgi:hypothetical protein
MKELKKLQDEAEVHFIFLSKNQLKLLKSYIKSAYLQGKLDTLKHETN